jgi:hypothetical protein
MQSLLNPIKFAPADEFPLALIGTGQASEANTQPFVLRLDQQRDS